MNVCGQPPVTKVTHPFTATCRRYNDFINVELNPPTQCVFLFHKASSRPSIQFSTSSSHLSKSSGSWGLLLMMTQPQESGRNRTYLCLPKLPKNMFCRKAFIEYSNIKLRRPISTSFPNRWPIASIFLNRWRISFTVNYRWTQQEVRECPLQHVLRIPTQIPSCEVDAKQRSIKFLE